MGWPFLVVFIVLQWNEWNLKDKPNVLCVQETWLKPQLDFVVKGFTAVRKDRRWETGRGGAVATFIQTGMSNKVVYVSTGHEAIGIKIWAERGPIGIITYYIFISFHIIVHVNN